MLTKYDTEKLERAMYDFNRATGVSITLFDLEKNPVTFGGVGSCQYCASISGLKEHKQFCAKSNSELLDKCRKSRQLTKHICRAGLLDIAIPLIHAGEVVGYLMIGQIKQTGFSLIPLSVYLKGSYVKVDLAQIGRASCRERV